MERLVLAAALTAVLTPCQGFNIDRELSTTFQDPARGFGQSVEQLRKDVEELVLFVFPWTRRYFKNIGSLSSVVTILENPNVREHGKKVLTALRGAVKNMDNIKGTLAHLSELHAEKLHVDPQNFKLLENFLMVDLGRKLGAILTPSVEAAWEKFLAMTSAILSKRYQ